jgi:UDP-N-acetyl-D-mannosaminouronate:lipid I N-acetyl-D-mannosaminouronosyltransferase
MIAPLTLNSIKIYPFQSRKQLIDSLEGESRILIALNAEKLLHAGADLKRIINANIGYADGIGATMGLHKKGIKGAIKIPGCELWLTLVESFYKSKTFYLLGASDEVINETVSKLNLEFPGIQIAGYRNGYLKSEEERQAVINEVVRLKPDVVFVAMGSPRQELLMEAMQALHPAIYQGLGGSFDVFVGKLKRAPKIWVDLKLEWFYRLLLEPKRIKRQIHLVRFFWLLLLNKI